MHLRVTCHGLELIDSTNVRHSSNDMCDNPNTTIRELTPLLPLDYIF